MHDSRKNTGPLFLTHFHSKLLPSIPINTPSSVHQKGQTIDWPESPNECQEKTPKKETTPTNTRTFAGPIVNSPSCIQPTISKSLYVRIPARNPSSFPDVELPTLLQVNRLLCSARSAAIQQAQLTARAKKYVASPWPRSIYLATISTLLIALTIGSVF